MNWTLYVSRKISLSASGRRKSPAVKVAIAAVALSAAVMLASIAIVAGFKEAIRQKVFGFNSHLTVTLRDPDPEQGNLMRITPTLRGIFDSEPYITAYGAEISAPAIFKTPTDFKGIYLKGIENEATARFFDSCLEEGRLPTFASDSCEILISRIAADQLRLKAGDKVNTYFVTDQIKVRPMRISGIFNSHTESYDDIFAYAPLRTVADAVGTEPGKATSVHIATDNFERIPEYTARLQQRLDSAVLSTEIFAPMAVDNAMNQGAALFGWLQLLDTNVIVLLALMTAVSIVTLISAMLILSIERRRTIGLLRALGATRREVNRIFLNMAMRVAAIGLLAGNALMLVLLLIQQEYMVLPLDADSYYIDYVPVRVELIPVLLLNVAVAAVVFLALALPSRAASRVAPADVLRSE